MAGFEYGFFQAAALPSFQYCTTPLNPLVVRSTGPYRPTFTHAYLSVYSLQCLCIPSSPFLQYYLAHTHLLHKAMHTYSHTQFLCHTHSFSFAISCYLSLPLCVWFVLLWYMQHAIVLWFWAQVPEQSRTTSQGAGTTNTVAYMVRQKDRDGQNDEWTGYNMKDFWLV